MSLTALQFAALGDPTRCRIVELLAAGAKPVHTLASHFEISRPAISRHLRVLREAGIVREERAGRENRYALRGTQLRAAHDWLAQFLARPAMPAAAPIRPAVPAPTRTMPTAMAARTQMELDF